MDVKQLRYFVSIARHGSFSRASADLRIAQPALSSQIAALEGELKTRLFVRHSRGVNLTEAGTALLSRALDIITRIEEAAREVGALGNGTTLTVRLGLPTTMTGVIAMPLIDAFAVRHPDIALHIVEGMTGHLGKWLDQDDIDGAILYERSGPSHSSFARIGHERLVVIGNNLHHFADRTTVTFHDLANIPFVHTTSAHQLRRMIDRYSAELRVPLSLLSEIDSLPQLRELLLTISGFTILPESMSLDWSKHGLRYWTIVKPEINVAHYLVGSPRFARQAKANAILDLVSDVIRNLIASGRWPGATLGLNDVNDTCILLDRLSG